MAAPKPTSTPKKVTPVQVAFLVERYLADNHFSASLSSFRSEASHLFSRTRSKEVPRGLLSLSEILDDYISLKERRVAVEAAMQGMRDVISAYYSASPLPPHPSSPPLVPPLFVAPNTSPPPTGGAGYVSPAIQYTQTSLVVQHSSEANNLSTPLTSSLATKKRKATKSAGKIPSAPKKPCGALSTTTYPKGRTVPSQLSIDNPEQNMGSAAQPSSTAQTAMINLPVQGSAVAKSLFKPLQPKVHSSPCTPQQNHPTEGRPSSVVANAHAQQEIASSQCSIVSSQTLIVSPLKGGAYYAVERSYRVSSPLKPSTHKSKREHVKGKLDFDSSDGRASSHEQICDKVSTSSDGEKQDDFDIDFANFDIFDGEFSFSELLFDLDLGTEGVPSQNFSTNAEVQRLEPVAKTDCTIVDPLLPDPVKPMAADPTEYVNSEGTTSVTSVRAITKRIKIVSPIKGQTAS